MRFRRLRLSGFKSFADAADLVILPGLTGIVGPNGCGKSNLLEAIRWVMGEASPKSLRGAGMDDVIFAGTARRPSRDVAEVTVLLEHAAADGTPRETEVARRIERGAGSGYRIDGQDARQRDVALLFADAATGAHSPALVSQGRIGAIIAARPAERRAMLEEAAGIAGLHVRRREAEQRLAATETNLARLDTALSDMAARAAALRRQARVAERYRTVSTALRLAEARLIYARWRDAAAAAADARRAADAADAQVTAAAERLRHARAEAEDTARLRADARSGAQAARDAVAAATSRRDGLTAEQATLSRRLADSERQCDTLARDRAREAALAEDAGAAFARLRAEEAAIDARVTQAAEARPMLDAQIGEREQALRDSEVALAQAHAAEAAEQAEVRIADAAMVAARQRLQRAEGAIERIAREQSALRDATALEAAATAAGLARDAATRDVARLEAAIAVAEAERSSAAAARDAAQAAVAASRAELAALDAEVTAMHRALPAVRAGRCALDHLRIAPGYERAVAAALGEDLDAAIGADGRARWAGSTTTGDPALPPGCVGLADHVAAPAALARRLAQVGLVEADDGAIVLAVGQRLVTRDGRLRRWDGFIAEDRGVTAAEGLIRRNRLRDIEAQLPATRAALAQATAALREGQARLERAQAEERAARVGRSQAETRLREAGLTEDRARLDLDRLGTRRAELATQAASLDADRAQAAAETAAAAAVIAALPEATRVRVAPGRHRAAAAAARADVVRLRADLAALDRNVAADRDRRVAAASEIRGWQARADDARQRVADLTARATAAEAERAGLAATPARLAGRIAAAEDDRAQAAAALAEAVSVETRAEAATRAAETRLATAGETLVTIREQRATALARCEALDLRRVEMGRIASERFHCSPPLLPQTAGIDAGSIGPVGDESRRLETLTLDRERIGPVNLVAEQELGAIEAEQAAQAAEREDLGHAVARLRGSIGSLNREGRTRLTAAFETVDAHFRRLFARLFAGGEAHLALIDSADPLEAGLEIMAQPPGKALSSLGLLSGGEQALTAIALIFALFLTNPAPLCVLDEVDAPLDDANVERFCALLDEMTEATDTRYLVVTHNAVTMARMHRLFGVTMIEQGISRLVSVDLGGAPVAIAAE